MAQKRMISKRVTESDKIISLRGKNIARFLYTALLPYTDKLGRINVNPAGLKGTIFEPFEWTVDEIEEALADLAAVGLIQLYSTPKHALLAEYTQFEKFNKPHANEADSTYPGPEDDVSDAPPPSGNLPEKIREIAGRRSTPTPTKTPTQSPKKEEVSSDEDSAEARFARVAETGWNEQAEVARVRSTIRRLAGEKFALKHEPNMPSWSRHSTERVTAFWAASDPRLWPKERGKRRTWLFADLLHEERFIQNEEPERSYDEDVTGADLLDGGSLEGSWKN